LDPCHPDTDIYVSKDVRIRGHFSKPKGPVSEKVWETLVWTIENLKMEAAVTSVT
jgi:hypothetical protein